MKNPHFDNLICELTVSDVEMKIDEFQILFLIDYLGNMNKGNNKLAQETFNDANQQTEEKEQIANFIKKKSGIFDLENENLKYLKKRIDEFDQKLQEKRVKNRYKQFVKSYSISLKKNKLLNESDSIENNKKTLYILLEFNVVKFTIKKNFTDFTVEDYLIYEQKLLKIEYFIVETGDMMVKLVINDIEVTIEKDKYEYDISVPLEILKTKINVVPNNNKASVDYKDINRIADFATSDL